MQRSELSTSELWSYCDRPYQMLTRIHNCWNYTEYYHSFLPWVQYDFSHDLAGGLVLYSNSRRPPPVLLSVKYYLAYAGSYINLVSSVILRIVYSCTMWCTGSYRTAVSDSPGILVCVCTMKITLCKISILWNLGLPEFLSEAQLL